MKHAVLSPSSAHRWLVCPGSVEANRGKPWEQSIYALEGTSAHALLEVCLRTGSDPEEFLDKVLGQDANGDGLMPVDEDMVDAVGFALDYVRGYMVQNPKALLRIEKAVYPGKQLGLKPHSLCWGTPDIQLVTPNVECVTIDYKHGIGIPVPVKDNPQIKLYHLGSRQEHGRYRRYRSVVVQPRIPKRRPIQAHTITDKELVTWAEDVVKPVLPLALSDNAPRVPGDHCRYCAAEGKCPAQLKQAFDKAGKEFGKVAKDPKGVSLAEIARYLDQVGFLENSIAALKAHAIRVAHSGVKIPGYVPAMTNQRRIWRDEEEAAQALGKLGLTPREKYEVSLLTPAKVEKVLRGKGQIAPKKRGQPRQTSPLEDLVAYTEANPTIAKEPPPDSVG
jgi:hypothetical protein